MDDDSRDFQIIGAMCMLSTKVRDRGRMTVICSLSEYMRSALQNLRLKAFWTRYDTREDALRAMSELAQGDP